MTKKYFIRIASSGRYIITNYKGYTTTTLMNEDSINSNMKYLDYCSSMVNDCTQAIGYSSYVAAFSTFAELEANYPELFL